MTTTTKATAAKTHRGATADDSTGRVSRPGGSPPTPRRNWLVEWGALVCGGLVSLLPPGIGALTFLDPWRRAPSIPKSRRSGGGGQPGFTRVAALDALAIGGPPQRFPVISDQLDAWNFTPDQPIGAVFLQRVSENEVRCFNATCPHAGCSVSCVGAAFLCPCHNSSFNLDGTKLVSDSGRENPSPRNLDGLEVDPDMLARNEVWIRFLNFYTGKHEKIPKD